MVQPEYDDDQRVTSVIHVDSILRGVHLIPVYGEEFTDTELHFSHSLDVFRTFYISKYSDYHAFQLLHTSPRWTILYYCQLQVVLFKYIQY